MIKAVMLWDQPNNASHWDPEVDPDGSRFAELAMLAGRAIHDVNPGVTRVLGGISPIDPAFVRRLAANGVLEHVDALAVQGFPLDWSPWQVEEWPGKLAEIQALTALPVWVSAAGVSSFGSDELQAWGLDRTAALLVGRTPCIHWHSLYDAAAGWAAGHVGTDPEDSAPRRRLQMGLLRADGTPKPALHHFERHAPALGIHQAFHFQDRRLAEAAAWLRRLGVRQVRTGLSWADSFRPGALEWFDRQLTALRDFEVTLTFSGTPLHFGIRSRPTSAPRDPALFAAFCASMVARYAPAHSAPVRVRAVAAGA